MPCRTEMIFDYFGVHLNGVRAANARGIFNVDLAARAAGSKLELENGVLNHIANAQAEDPDATITLSRETLNKIILKENHVEKGATGRRGDDRRQCREGKRNAALHGELRLLVSCRHP